MQMCSVTTAAHWHCVDVIVLMASQPPRVLTPTCYPSIAASASLLCFQFPFDSLLPSSRSFSIDGNYLIFLTDSLYLNNLVVSFLATFLWRYYRVEGEGGVCLLLWITQKCNYPSSLCKYRNIQPTPRSGCDSDNVPPIIFPKVPLNYNFAPDNESDICNWTSSFLLSTDFMDCGMGVCPTHVLCLQLSIIIRLKWKTDR